MLLADAELWLERGEHVSLVGPNGTGKTTLIQALVGERPLDGGRLRTGHNVKVGYLSQHAEELEGGGARTVLEAAVKRTGLPPNQARALLGRFLFSGEEAEKPLDGLSGGERRRLSLAILVQSGANVLILDEPTNHLDLESREALEDALQAFPGSLLLVTHDRALLDAVGTRTIAVEDYTLRSYVGGWAEYARVREERKAMGLPPSSAARAGRPTARRAPSERRSAKATAGEAQARRPVEEPRPRAGAPRARRRAGRGGAGGARGGAGRPEGVGHEVRVGQVDRAPHRGQARGRGGLRGARGVRGEGLMLRHELPGGYALRLLEEADADELFALIDANREHLGPVDAVGAAATASPPTCCPSSALTRRQIADNDGLQTAIVDPDGRIVGMVGIHGIDWLNRKTSIGYWLARRRAGPRDDDRGRARATSTTPSATWKLNRVTIQAAVEQRPQPRHPRAPGVPRGGDPARGRARRRPHARRRRLRDARRRLAGAA